MANKFNEMKALVVLFIMVLVSNVFSACDNELTDMQAPVTMTETVKKDNPKDTIPQKDPELEFYLIPVHESDSNVVVIADTIGEKTTNSYWIQNGKAVLSLKQYDYVTEMKYKNLNVAFSNANKTMAEPEVSERNGEKRYTTKCSFSMEDGNIGYINADSYQMTEKFNGKDHTFEYAKLNSFEVLSLNNVEKATTRAAYVADSCFTEAKVLLHYVYENSNVQGFDVVLVDTCFRKFLAEDDIDFWEYDNVFRKVLTTTTEQCGFRKVGHMKSGEIKYLDKSIILQYGIAPIDQWELIVKSFAFDFYTTNGIAFGETVLNRTEGAWKVNRRNFVYGSVFNTPMGDRIDTKYNGFSEGATYDDGDVKVDEFPVLDMKVSEGNSNVTEMAGDDWYDKALFTNNINADYQGYPQSASETVILKKEAKRLISEGWDEMTAKKTITLWNINATIDYVKRYSDDTEERTTYVMDFGWNFGPKSKWSVYAENNSYYTGNVVANVNGGAKSKNAKDGATWGWQENNHSFVAEVSVANGTQKDEWYATTVNDITIERNGNVYNFGHDDYNMVDGGAKLGNATSTDSEDVYPYTHALTFGMGGVTGDATVNGEIHVEKVIVPDTFFGSKVLSVSQIVCNNQNRSDYMYSVLAHLENGQVVPGIWNRNGNIEFHLEWAVAAEANNLNGAAYEPTSGTWVPVHAWDSPDMLQYDSQTGSNVDNQGYVTAMQWNWDEGKKVDGHASVNTSRFSFTLENGVLSATDSYTGNSVGSWTYTK